MEQTSPCPSDDRLADLLAGRLSSTAESELAAHLDGCPRCRKRLEESAGGTAWLPPPEQWGPGAEPPVGEDLRQAMNHVLTSLTQAGTPLSAPAGPDVPQCLGPPAQPDHVGQFGPYGVLEILGRGGMGIVLKAHDPLLNRTVAIKVMLPELAADPVHRVRFLREAQSAAAVNHANLVTIHAVDRLEELPYLVMEYVEGVSLQERIDQGGPLSVEEIVRIGAEIASGLAAAHGRGLVHRDIKPANVLLARPDGQVKITDFGLAKSATDVGITKSDTFVGTPQYMAPEQAAGERADHRSDLFSFGSVLYAMCAGRPPFDGRTISAVVHQLATAFPPSLRELDPGIPAWLAEIVQRLLAKDPRDRYQSAAEVAAILERRLASLRGPTADGAHGRTDSDTSRSEHSRGLRQQGLAVAGVVALAIVLGIVAQQMGWLDLGLSPGETTRDMRLPDRGFVLHSRSGGKKVLSSLSEAVTAARGGEAIEILWSGTVDGNTIRVTKPLTLRAAEGCRPVFEATSSGLPRIHASAPLILEGIDFQYSPDADGRLPPQAGRGPSPHRGIILATESPLYIANCRFVLRGQSLVSPIAGIAALVSPLCEVRNCLFVGSGGPGIRWTCIRGGQLLIDNSAFVSFTSVDVIIRGQKQPSLLRLTRNAFYTQEAVFVACPTRPEGRVLEVQARENVFGVLSVLTQPPHLLLPLGRVMAWTDDRNVYSVGHGYISARSVDDALGTDTAIAADLEAWRKVWGHGESGVREGAPALSREAVQKMKSAPDKLTAADLPFSDLSAGVDVEWLGPGEPYERWRRTQQYRQWSAHAASAQRAGD